MSERTYAQIALQTAHERYIERNAASRKAHEDAHRHLPGGNTRTVLHAEPFPITWASGQDSKLSSIDGNAYTDFLGEFSAGIFGHSDPRIAEAVREAMSGGWNFGGNSMREKKFAVKICERFGPSGVDLVRFTNSGTEANTTALGAALAVTGKRKILVFSGGYHGSTLVFSMQLMKGSTAPCMNLPHEFIFAPYNNVEETKSVVRAHGEENLAAILVEPIQGSGGCRPATRDFLHYLRSLADQTGAFLVIDEVMSSRLGVSGYSATQGIKGDIVTLGKYIAGGMTFGAFGGRKDIMERFDPSKNQLFHPGTYNNNVLSMSAGLVGLEIYDSVAVDRLNELGIQTKTAIQQIFIDEGVYPTAITNPVADIVEIESLKHDTRLEVDGDPDKLQSLPKMFITGRGSMLNVRFSGAEAPVWQALFYHHMLVRNIYIATRGYTPLHLRLTADDTRKYADAVQEFVHQHRAQLCAEPSIHMPAASRMDGDDSLRMDEKLSTASSIREIVV